MAHKSGSRLGLPCGLILRVLYEKVRIMIGVTESYTCNQLIPNTSWGRPLCIVHLILGIPYLVQSDTASGLGDELNVDFATATMI